jgi:hypothetical protein
MMTHRMRIRRQLRSARVSVLTFEERREALLAAERARAQKRKPPRPVDEAAHGPTPEPRVGSG